MTILERREATTRKGLTLVEIMMAVLVLSVGLLGVLAAIPFGAFQMARMKDADYSSTVSNNAFSTIVANNWHNPSVWNGNSGTQSDVLRNVVLNNDNTMNLTSPFLLDTIRGGSFAGTCAWEIGSTNLWLRVWPQDTLLDKEEVKRLQNMGEVERFFLTHDDILYGTTDAEKNGDFRPTMESDADGAMYTGEYSWMAMMQPQRTTSPVDSCPLNEIQQVKTDVVVFKGRSPVDDPLFRTVALPQNLYKGGTINLPYDLDLMEALKSSTHVLLTGNADVDGIDQRYAEWFRIANFTQGDNNNVIRLTVTGPATPKFWNTNNVGDFTLVVFPNVVGVRTRYLSID